MNEELTREVLEEMKKCKQNCPSCSAIEVCSKHGWQEMIESLAAALLEERAKPKVWDGAPEWAKSARVMWSDTCKNEPTNRGDYSPLYTRELPKTRARQIAEKISAALSSQDRYKPEVKIIESVLEKYAEELKEASHDK